MSSFRKRVGGETPPAQDSKALGPKISSRRPSAGTSDIDGDGDGFVTGPDGRDNIPAPIAQAGESIRDAWNAAMDEQLKADEGRAMKARDAAQRKMPRESVAEIGEKLATARRREEIVAAKQAAIAFAKAMFEIDGLGDDGSYKAVIISPKDSVQVRGNKFKGADMDHPELHIFVSGVIQDKDGNRVGFFERSIFVDDENRKGKPYVYHDFLKLNDSVKGRGIGADFTITTEAKYEALNLDEIHLNAAMSDGAYTWSRAGYRFKNETERKRFMREIRRRVDEMTKEAGGVDKLIAGGFETMTGALRKDGPRKLPKDLFNSREEYDVFMRLLDDVENGDAQPAALTVFSKFAKAAMQGIVVDMKKPVGGGRQMKALVLRGLDKILRIV